MESIRKYLDEVTGLRPLVSVIMFGSAASGAFAPGTSDVDLILVMPDGSGEVDRNRIHGEVEALETAYGFRALARRRTGRIQKLAERVSGHAMSSFICNRSDLLSGETKRILGLSGFEDLFVDRIVIAGVLASAVTVWGEELLPEVRIQSIRRLDVFKALFNFLNIIAMSAIGFAFLPDATKYAAGALKHSLHSCYFCYHLKTATLQEEVEFFSSGAGTFAGLKFVALMEQRRAPTRSLGFVLRCVPILLRLHLRTAFDNRFPRRVVK